MRGSQRSPPAGGTKPWRFSPDRNSAKGVGGGSEGVQRREERGGARAKGARNPEFTFTTTPRPESGAFSLLPATSLAGKVGRTDAGRMLGAGAGGCGWGRPAPSLRAGKLGLESSLISPSGAGAAVEQRLMHLSALRGASLAYFPPNPRLPLCRLCTPRGYGTGLGFVQEKKQSPVICLLKAHRCSPQASNLQDSSLPEFKCTFVPSQCIKKSQCSAFSSIGSGPEYPGGLQGLASCQELESSRSRHFLQPNPSDPMGLGQGRFYKILYQIYHLTLIVSGCS